MSTHRYTSEFISNDSHRWRADIDRAVDDGEDALVIVAEDFDFDLQAAVISWKATEKWEPLQGSACTLRVVSPADRTFIDLYAAAPGEVTLQLYRDDTLFWTGTLDPEFYEEPYTAAANYEVELTFSDLGALERLPYDGTTSGHMNFDWLVKRALASAHLPQNYLLQTGLCVAQNSPLELYLLRVAAANFIDEEGEPMKWSEVLAGILQPLGLRIVQHQGQFVVYDLFTARSLTPTAIAWDADDATLGVDKVYNNISVEFSPYGDSSVADCEIRHDELEDSAQPWGIVYNQPGGSDKYESFRYQRNSHEGLPQIDNSADATVYKMDSLFGGEDGAGIARKIGGKGVYAGGLGGTEQSVLPIQFGACPYVDPTDPKGKIYPLFTAVCTDFAPSLDGTSNLLKITLTMMLDGRYNPFEDAKDNCEARANQITKYFKTVYVPVKIWYELPDGTTMTYRNNATRVGDINVSGTWWTAEPKWGDAWLCFYDWTDLKDTSPCKGWMTNRPCIGSSTKSVPELWQKRGDGEYLPIPGEVLMQGGTLNIQVGDGVNCVDYNSIATIEVVDGRYMLTAPQWVLYKKVSVEVVDRYGRTVESEDVVRATVLNEQCRDDLTINTICGTAAETGPTARGVITILRANQSQSTALSELKRGAITDTVENLLIAAVAGQYDSRHTTLSGTVRADSFAMFGLFVDAAQPAGRVFLPDQAEFNIQAGEVNTRFVELSEQKYSPHLTSDSLWPTLNN